MGEAGKASQFLIPQRRARDLSSVVAVRSSSVKRQRQNILLLLLLLLLHIVKRSILELRS
jgi:hypothetical protein